MLYIFRVSNFGLGKNMEEWYLLLFWKRKKNFREILQFYSGDKS